MKDIGHRPLNGYADHCAILPNERINRYFGGAVESSESQKSPVDQSAGRGAHPPHEPIIQRSENMRPRASKFWPLAQVTHAAPSRSHLTGLSILSTKDSNSQALNRAHLWIPWTIKHPVTYRSCIHALYSFGSSVNWLGERCHTGWRCLSGRFDRLSAKIRPAAAILRDLDLAELVDDILPFKVRKNGGASLGILLNLLLVAAQRVAWLDSADARGAFTSFVV